MVEFRPLTSEFGAEAIDIDLARPVAEVDFERIRAAFLEHGLILFRDQTKMSVAQQLGFSKRFGRLETDLKAETTLEGHPEILVLTNLKVNGIEIGTPLGGRFWHSDLYFERIPAAVSLLHAIVVPDAEGDDVGDTVFANMTLAYEALPSTHKERIGGLRNQASRVKSWPINYPDRPPLSPEQVAAYPDVIHPLVRTHPETGRKSLFIGDISAGTIEGLPVNEGDELLRELRDFATQPRFVYRHHWRVGDAILWDNRCTIHAATAFDGERYQRHMHRTTIMDDVVPY